MKTVTLMIGVMAIVTSANILIAQVYAQGNLTDLSSESQTLVTKSSFKNESCSPVLKIAETKLTAELNSISVEAIENIVPKNKNNENILRLQSLFECYITSSTRSKYVTAKNVLASQEQVQNSIDQLFNSTDIDPISSPSAFMINYYSQLLTEMTIEISLQTA